MFRSFTVVTLSFIDDRCSCRSICSHKIIEIWLLYAPSRPLRYIDSPLFRDL